MNIYPSLISAPLLSLGQTIKHLEPHCAGFHLDVMDFHFVPNLTWGPVFINAIRQASHKQLWIHLMVDTPIHYVKAFELWKNDIISLHYESVPRPELKQLLILIKEQGFQAGLAINPVTSLYQTIELFPYIDQFLLMSVNPGFSGQSFLTSTYERLAEVYELRSYHQASFRIALDGGLTENILNSLTEVDDVAMAHALFNNQADPVEILKRLNK